MVAVRFGHDAANSARRAVADQRGGRRPQRHRGHLGGAMVSRRPAHHPIPGAMGEGPVLGDLARPADAVGFHAVLASHRAETGRDLVLPGTRQQRRRTVERLVVHRGGDDGIGESAHRRAQRLDGHLRRRLHADQRHVEVERALRLGGDHRLRPAILRGQQPMGELDHRLKLRPWEVRL